MTLLDESDAFFILVSPYIKISRWYKLLKKLEQLRDRQIPLYVFVRDDQSNSQTFDELERLGISYTAVPDLHAKLYMNEKYGIMTSLNLLLSSEINSIELGYQTQTEEEHAELMDFCKRYLSFEVRPDKHPSAAADKEPPVHPYILLPQIVDALRNILGYSIRVWEKQKCIKINTGINNYGCTIQYERHHFLSISGILSSVEYDEAKKHTLVFQRKSGLDIELCEGGNGCYDTIWGTSGSIANVKVSEMAQWIANFVFAVDDFKEEVRESQYRAKQ